MFTVVLLLVAAYMLGRAAGRASVADEAIADLRELQAEFDRLSAEAADIRARADEHIPYSAPR